MREMTSILLRGLCLAAVLTAGSCSSPSGDEKTVFDDPVANHPILVQPSSQSLEVNVSPAGIAPADTERFEAFVAGYQAHGNGKILISAPNGSPNGAAALLADRINAMGVSRDKI